MSARRVVTTRRADEDIAAAIEHDPLDQGAPHAALAFVDDLEDTRILLGEHPPPCSTRLGSEVEVPELRTKVLRRFPYPAFYTAFYTDDVDALRVGCCILPGTSRPVSSTADGGGLQAASGGRAGI